MSSSDEPLDWGAFAERPVPVEEDVLSPASELAALLQLHRADLDAAQEEGRQSRADGLARLARQAVLVFQLESALSRYKDQLEGASFGGVHRHLRVLKDQMRDALREAEIEIIDPTGRPFDDVVDKVEVEGWRHGPQFEAEVVAQVAEPLVMHDGALLRPGRVVMGAPEENAPDTGPPSNETPPRQPARPEPGEE